MGTARRWLQKYPDQTQILVQALVVSSGLGSISSLPFAHFTLLILGQVYESRSTSVTYRTPSLNAVPKHSIGWFRVACTWCIAMKRVLAHLSFSFFPWLPPALFCLSHIRPKLSLLINREGPVYDCHRAPDDKIRHLGGRALCPFAFILPLLSGLQRWTRSPIITTLSLWGAAWRNR